MNTKPKQQTTKIPWCSNETRRKKKQASKLAIIETFLLVILTWGLAWYFDSFLHIYIAILLAPLLLLKTEKSIATANDLFLKDIEIDEDNLYKGTLPFNEKSRIILKKRGYS